MTIEKCLFWKVEIVRIWDGGWSGIVFLGRNERKKKVIDTERDPHRSLEIPGRETWSPVRHVRVCRGACRLLPVVSSIIEFYVLTIEGAQPDVNRSWEGRPKFRKLSVSPLRRINQSERLLRWVPDIGEMTRIINMKGPIFFFPSLSAIDHDQVSEHARDAARCNVAFQFFFFDPAAAFFPSALL